MTHTQLIEPFTESVTHSALNGSRLAHWGNGMEWKGMEGKRMAHLHRPVSVWSVVTSSRDLNLHHHLVNAKK